MNPTNEYRSLHGGKGSVGLSPPGQDDGGPLAGCCRSLPGWVSLAATGCISSYGLLGAVQS